MNSSVTASGERAGQPSPVFGDPMHQFDLSGRVAIITGGARNLGLVLSRGLAACGVRVAVVSRTRHDAIAAVEQINGDGGTAIAVAADVANLADHGRIIETTVNAYGRLDILVNNAGMALRTPISDLTEEQYDHVHSVNAKGPIFLSKAALPHLAASGHGSVINMLSITLWTGGPASVLYRSTKSALFGATMVMAREWASLGVRANAIAPGTFDAGLGAMLDDSRRELARGSSPQRRLGHPNELVSAVIYLASDASSYVTGATLRVDGGVVSG